MSICLQPKRLFSVLLMCLLLFQYAALCSYAAYVPSFPDVQPSDWFYEDVLYAIDHDLIDGYPDGRFCPNDNITYAQVISALCRAGGIAEEDTSLSHNLAYALSQGWYSPVEDLHTDPSAFAKRKVVCRVLLAFAGITPYAHEMYDTCCFADFSAIRNIYGVDYQDYACAGYQLGLFTGDQSGNYRPEDLITRAEFCAILRRLLSKTDLSCYSAPELFMDLPVIALDQASEKDVLAVKNELAHFPAALIQLFISKGWEIRITDQSTVNAYVSSKYDVTGFTDHQKKVICVSAYSAFSRFSLIHEFGHFVKAHCKADPYLLSTAFQSEAGRISHYAVSSKEEYFAEAFSRYMSSSPDIQESFKSNCPLSYELLDFCVNQLIS